MACAEREAELLTPLLKRSATVVVLLEDDLPASGLKLHWNVPCAGELGCTSCVWGKPTLGCAVMLCRDCAGAKGAGVKIGAKADLVLGAIELGADERVSIDGEGLAYEITVAALSDKVAMSFSSVKSVLETADRIARGDEPTAATGLRWLGGRKYDTLGDHKNRVGKKSDLEPTCDIGLSDLHQNNDTGRWETQLAICGGMRIALCHKGRLHERLLPSRLLSPRGDNSHIFVHRWTADHHASHHRGGLSTQRRPGAPPPLRTRAHRGREGLVYAKE